MKLHFSQIILNLDSTKGRSKRRESLRKEKPKAMFLSLGYSRLAMKKTGIMDCSEWLTSLEQTSDALLALVITNMYSVR